MSRKFRSWNMVDGDEIRRGILNDATLAASEIRVEQCFFPSPKDRCIRLKIMVKFYRR